MSRKEISLDIVLELGDGLQSGWVEQLPIHLVSDVEASIKVMESITDYCREYCEEYQAKEYGRKHTALLNPTGNWEGINESAIIKYSGCHAFVKVPDHGGESVMTP